MQMAVQNNFVRRMASFQQTPQQSCKEGITRTYGVADDNRLG